MVRGEKIHPTNKKKGQQKLEENPNIEDLKRKTVEYMKREQSVEIEASHSFMYEAGHRDRQVIDHELREDPRFEVTDKSISWRGGR